MPEGRGAGRGGTQSVMTSGCATTETLKELRGAPSNSTPVWHPGGSLVPFVNPGQAFPWRSIVSIWHFTCNCPLPPPPEAQVWEEDSRLKDFVHKVPKFKLSMLSTNGHNCEAHCRSCVDRSWKVLQVLILLQL